MKDLYVIYKFDSNDKRYFIKNVKSEHLKIYQPTN